MLSARRRASCATRGDTAGSRPVRDGGFNQILSSKFRNGLRGRGREEILLWHQYANKQAAEFGITKSQQCRSSAPGSLRLAVPLYLARAAGRASADDSASRPAMAQQPVSTSFRIRFEHSALAKPIVAGEPQRVGPFGVFPATVGEIVNDAGRRMLEGREVHVARRFASTCS